MAQPCCLVWLISVTDYRALYLKVKVWKLHSCVHTWVPGMQSID
jgi:hypothetical protein